MSVLPLSYVARREPALAVRLAAERLEIVAVLNTGSQQSVQFHTHRLQSRHVGPLRDSQALDAECGELLSLSAGAGLFVA